MNGKGTRSEPFEVSYSEYDWICELIRQGEDAIDRFPEHADEIAERVRSAIINRFPEVFPNAVFRIVSGEHEPKPYDFSRVIFPEPNASGDLPSKEEWISRCEQQYMARGCDRPYAIHAAEACWELIEGDLTESPEELADEDLSCG